MNLLKISVATKWKLSEIFPNKMARIFCLRCVICQNRLSKDPSRKGNTHNLTKSIRELASCKVIYLAQLSSVKMQFIPSTSRIKKNGLTGQKMMGSLFARDCAGSQEQLRGGAASAYGVMRQGKHTKTCKKEHLCLVNQGYCFLSCKKCNSLVRKSIVL